MEEKSKLVRKPNGLTLVELLIALFISAMVLGTIATIFLVAVKSHTQVQVERDVLQEASWGLERMMKTLRQASQIYGSEAVGLISNATRLYCLVEADEIYKIHKYTWEQLGAAGRIYRERFKANTDLTPEGNQVNIANLISAFEIYYYEEGQTQEHLPKTPLDDGSNITLVKIKMKGEKKRGISGEQEVTLTSQARLRSK